MSPFVNHVAIAGFAALLVWAAVEDIRTFKIPNRISLAAIGLYPAHALAAPTGVDWIAGLGVGVAVLVVGFLMFAMRWAGAGDIKLIAAASLWAGPAMIGPLLIVTALAGGALSVAMLVRNRVVSVRSAAQAAGGADKPPISDSLKTSVPYGAAIAAGGLFVAARLFAL